MKQVPQVLDTLKQSFKRAHSKHEAQQLCQPILEQLSRQPQFLTEVFKRSIEMTGFLNRPNFPVIGLIVEENPDFSLVVHCWTPRQDGSTAISTRPIHHHGNLLLSTVTLFGPGYQHWIFKPTQLLDAENALYSTELSKVEEHPLHHFGFVDAWAPHAPFYPGSATVTVALWCNQLPTNWKDYLKRVPALKKREKFLRSVVNRIGMNKAMEIKEMEYFDFCPTEVGFKGLKERVEHSLGDNEDFLVSFFHILQRTGNEHLASSIRGQLDSGSVKNEALVQQLLGQMEKGSEIEGKLSPCHYQMTSANFGEKEIREALHAVENLRNVRTNLKGKGITAQSSRV